MKINATTASDYQSYRKMSLLGQIGTFLAVKPGPKPSLEVAQKSSSKDRTPKIFGYRKQRPVKLEQPIDETHKFHHAVYWIPRVVVNTAAQINGTINEGNAFRSALEAHSHLHAYGKTRKISEKKTHAIEVAFAITMLVNSIFLPSVAGILGDCQSIGKYSITLITELRSKNATTKQLLILTARITIRVGSLLSNFIPTISITVQLLKVTENSLGAYHTIRNAKKFNTATVIESMSDGLPAIMRSLRVYTKIVAKS